MLLFLCVFFKQKTAYELRISDWSSDVCSSDLDRVQVGRIWWQVEQLGLGGTDGLADSWTFVAGEVVHDDDVARCEGGHEELLDTFGKAGPVDRLIEDARCIDPVAAQRGDAGHGASSEERRVGKAWVGPFRSRWSQYH